MNVFSSLLISTLLLLNTQTACQRQPQSVVFGGQTLVFPLTVQQAETRYSLSFRPPGYYYCDDVGVEMSIGIPYKSASYWNEHQPKETLYDRSVIAYVFTYDGQQVALDSVQHAVEQLCQCKLSFQADSVDRTPGFPLRDKSLMPAQGRHRYAIARLSKDLVVGFRSKPSYQGLIIPEVRFLYGHTRKEIRLAMMQY